MFTQLTLTENELKSSQKVVLYSFKDNNFCAVSHAAWFSDGPSGYVQSQDYLRHNNVQLSNTNTPIMVRGLHRHSRKPRGLASILNEINWTL